VDTGVTVPDVSFRRPSRLLTQLLPAVAALLALACWALAALPFVLDPLPQPPPEFRDNDRAKMLFDAAVIAPDRVAPFRPGAEAPHRLALGYAVFGCLFAANAWMLPRLTRLRPAPSGNSTALAILGVLIILLVTAGLVALGYRPLIVVVRLLGGQFGEGFARDEPERAWAGFWWIACGGLLLLLDLVLLGTVVAARFGVGGVALLPPGQVAPLRDGAGLSRIKWLGVVSAGCSPLYVALLALPPSGSPPAPLEVLVGLFKFALVIVGVPLTALFCAWVLEWVPRNLLDDKKAEQGRKAPPPFPASQAIQAAEPEADLGIKAASSDEPDRG
jgi:hypothetical protein